MRVKIVSGWSNAGGSTQHHISLTNLFNASGIPCVFYGPHEWHLGRCKSELLSSLKVEKEDILLTHFIQLSVLEMQKSRMHILSCHETNLFPLKTLPFLPYAYIQYVSKSQKEWHNVDHPSIIIPPIVEQFEWSPPSGKTAGIIGSIDAHKRTHLSVSRALEEGYDKVYIIGPKTDEKYFNKVIHPLLNDKVQVLAYIEDKKKMYNMVNAVFHSSERETFNLIKAECTLNKVPYFGLASADTDGEILTKKEILDRWKLILGL